MGLFDFLKKAPESPEGLRDQLFAAVAAGDTPQLTALVEAHEASILEAFPGWQTVPPEVREDPAAMQIYANGLITVASYFAQVRGQPALLQRLTGGDGDNPLDGWEQALNQAQQLRSELRFSDATQLLSDYLIDARKLKGSGVDAYLPPSLGMLGDLHFQRGNHEQALESTRQALGLCEAQGDADGARAYLTNLYEMHRYRGQVAEAVECAERLGRLLDGPTGAWYRAQVPILRAGEPLNRVVSNVEGVRAEVKDTEPESRVRFVFQRNRISLFAATVWNQRGEELGGTGKYEDALTAFAEASARDPYDPQPVYQSAFTHLHLERHAEAHELYLQTESLAPGWFHCRANAWLAGEAAAGRLSHATLMRTLRLVDGVHDPSREWPDVEADLEEAPGVALVHLVASRVRAGLDDAAGALSYLRSGLERTADEDVHTRLLLHLGLALEGDERREALEQALELNGNLVAAATAQIVLKAPGQRLATRSRGEPL